MENLDSFKADVSSGRWDHVLETVLGLRLPESKLADLYEQVRDHSSTAPWRNNIDMDTADRDRDNRDEGD